MRRGVLFKVLIIAAGISPALAGERTEFSPSVGRGRETVRRPLNPPFWSLRAYQNAWRQWGVGEQPADYARAFRERYGLHPPLYENGGLPMGFTRPRGLLGLGQGLGNDCLLCHAGTVAGQTIIGLGNSALDMQSLYEELAAADGLPPVMPLSLCNVRGTSEASNFAVYLMQFRDAELRHRLPVKYPLCENLCEDVPAWWHFRKKKTIYHLGVADSRSVRTLMPFLLIPGNSAESIKEREPDFADIRAYLLSLEPPRYPYAIDRALAEQGKAVFEHNCLSLDAIRVAGARPSRARPSSSTTAGAATALTAARPATPTSSYHSMWPAPMPPWRTPLRRKVGLKFRTLANAPDPGLPAIDRRKVYDSTQPGRGNSGHTFGDRLTEEQRMAVIEYLKTL